MKRDFELWSPLVRPGGIIALHDIGPQEQHGVPRFWGELQDRFDTEEHVAADAIRYGIGVVHVR